MEKKYTSGPWEAVDKRPDGFTGYSIFHGGQFIAHVGDSDSATPVDANARLIAAAPELLEAVDRMLTWNHGGQRAEDVAFARRVYAKALGHDS